MTEFQAAPLCVVRNRGLAFTLSASGVEVTGYEKQDESTVDLTMGKLVDSGGEIKLNPAGMITEWVAGYPSISIINGDKQVPDTPLAARYTVTNLTPSSAQTLVQQGEEQYYSHSQLSFRSGGEMESYDNASGTDNANGATFTGNPPANPMLDSYPLASRIPVQISAVPGLFAAGFGELHLYAKP
jgi:hypothetical protein